MTRRALVGPALGAVIAFVAACFASLGEDCQTSDDCAGQLECVAIDDQRSVCVPPPETRAERACSDDAPCSSPDDPPWPVEAECGADNQCRCSTTAFECYDDSGVSLDPGLFVVDPATCLCRRRDTRGTACSDETCADGLSCEADGVCD